MSHGQIPVFPVFFASVPELAQAGWEAPSSPALVLLCVVTPCLTCSTWKTQKHTPTCTLCSSALPPLPLSWFKGVASSRQQLGEIITTNSILPNDY